MYFGYGSLAATTTQKIRTEICAFGETRYPLPPDGACFNRITPTDWPVSAVAGFEPTSSLPKDTHLLCQRFERGWGRHTSLSGTVVIKYRDSHASLDLPLQTIIHKTPGVPRVLLTSTYAPTLGIEYDYTDFA